MIQVFATFQFEGYHRWPEAPAEVDFLRSRHRHMFHVRVEKTVEHEDRNCEFIMLKHEAIETVEAAKRTALDHETWSCETWARYLVDAMGLSKCEVSEDGENGAVVQS